MAWPTTVLLSAPPSGHKKAFTFTFEVGNRSNIKFVNAMQTFLATAEQRRKEIRAMPKLDRKALRTFCAAWSDHGYNDYSTGDAAVYVLYEGWSLEEAAATRETVLAAIETMGLQIVAASSPGATPAEIRIAADPRIDLELEKWS